MLKEREMVRVADIMTRDVVTVGADASVAEAARLLSARRFSGLIVVNEQGAVTGVVSEYDIISKSGRRVADIMSTEVVSITESASVEEVARLMGALRIRRLPILADGRLVGIVTRADLVHFFAVNQWVCANCGFQTPGFEAPERCEQCGADRESFHLEPAPPGM